jgi:hypothetical protein
MVPREEDEAVGVVSRGSLVGRAADRSFAGRSLVEREGALRS